MPLHVLISGMAIFGPEGRIRFFSIDSSWIPNVEAAAKWYDKTITEFPSTSAARIAYEEKMRTLLGWKEAGRYGSTHGVEKNPTTYLPKPLENTPKRFLNLDRFKPSDIRLRKRIGAKSNGRIHAHG